MSDSFDFGDLGFDSSFGPPPTSQDVQPPPQQVSQQGFDPSFGPQAQPQATPQPVQGPMTDAGGGATPEAPATPDAGGKQSFVGGITDWLSQPSNLMKIGLGAGGLGLGLTSQRAAQTQGTQAQQQIAGIPQNLQALSTATQQQLQDLATKYQAAVNNSASAIQGMAAPIMQQYTNLINLTNQGQLTPANQQILDAARARIAQDAANKGGVGAEQAQAQLDRLQNTLLASQMTQALQMYQTASPATVTAQQTELAGTNAANQYLTQGMQTALSTTGLQDQYALNAIQTGLQQDQQARQSMQSFYAQLAAVLAGLPTSKVATA